MSSLINDGPRRIGKEEIICHAKDIPTHIYFKQTSEKDRTIYNYMITLGVLDDLQQ